MTVFTAFVSFLAQNQTPQSSQGSGGLLDAIGGQGMMLAIFAVMFYFLLIRPQSQQRKALQERINSLEPGLKVVTNFGLHALVHSVKERTVVLKIAEGTMAEFEKSVIASVQKREGDAPTKK